MQQDDSFQNSAYTDLIFEYKEHKFYTSVDVLKRCAGLVKTKLSEVIQGKSLTINLTDDLKYANENTIPLVLNRIYNRDWHTLYVVENTHKILQIYELFNVLNLNYIYDLNKATNGFIQNIRRKYGLPQQEFINLIKQLRLTNAENKSEVIRSICSVYFYQVWERTNKDTKKTIAEFKDDKYKEINDILYEFILEYVAWPTMGD